MEEKPGKAFYVLLVGLVTLVFAGWALIQLGVIPGFYSWMFFNMPVLLVLLAGILLFRKHGTMRAFMVVSVAGYLFEYIL